MVDEKSSQKPPPKKRVENQKRQREEKKLGIYKEPAVQKAPKKRQETQRW